MLAWIPLRKIGGAASQVIFLPGPYAIATNGGFERQYRALPSRQ